MGDAGLPAVFAHVGPVDILVLAGIFGNLTDADVRRTINAVPVLCRTGATVVWTRHRREPDLTAQIREWFNAAGCQSKSFVSAGAGRFAVGSETFGASNVQAKLPARLFTFRDDLW